MMDYKEWFEKMKRYSPKVEILRDNVEIEFWEELYQSFKQRMIDELPSGNNMFSSQSINHNQRFNNANQFIPPKESL